MTRPDTRRLPSVALLAVCLVVAGGAGRTAVPETAAPLALREPAGDGRLVVTSFALSERISDLDGQWQGIRVASDGKCYFASSTHSARRGASFWQYDPATGQVRLLCDDITRVCGEDPTKTPPQGKIHSEIVELDGWLYFGTHLANYWPEAAAAYTGGHAVGYELKSGAFRDFGVVHPNYSNYSGVAIDPACRRLYFYVTPFSEEGKATGGSHMYRIDLDTGAKQDLGQVAPGERASQWLFVDRRGDCWFTLTQDGGTLCRARADADAVERFENALPAMLAWNRETLAPPEQQRERRWRWAQPLPDGDRCLFTLAGGGGLWQFDASKPLSEAFTLVAHIGPTDLGMALAGDRVYYIQHEGRKKPGRGETLPLHLCSLRFRDDGPPVISDHGAIVDAQGRTPLRIPSLAADGRGRVYMVGDWNLLPGEKGTTRHARTRQGEDVYNELRRGQFFAVADLAVISANASSR